MDFTQLTIHDHAVASWNATNDPGTLVIRIDDLGHPHETVTTSEAWVLPSGTAVVKTKDQGAYKLSRIWNATTFRQMVEKFAPEGHEPVI